MPGLKALSLVLIVCSTNAFAIDTPPNPRGLAVGNSSIRWEWNWVPGVVQYEVTVGGQLVGLTPDPRDVSEGLWTGEHSMRVRAIDGDWQYSEQSITAKFNVTDQVGAGVNQNDQGGNQPLANNDNDASPPPQNDNGLVDPQSWTEPEAYQKDGYELVFSDEFNAGSLNPARWNTQLRWDGRERQSRRALYHHKSGDWRQLDELPH